MHPVDPFDSRPSCPLCRLVDRIPFRVLLAYERIRLAISERTWAITYHGTR